MKGPLSMVRLPSYDEETIAPVTILDAQGRVLRVVPGTEFHPPGTAGRAPWQARRRRHPRPTAGSPAADR
jgi:hypothetical protein